MRYAMHAGHVLSFLHMRITNNMVKVVNKPSGKCLAASSLQTGMQSAIESEYRIPISRSGAERESVVVWLISPGGYV